MSADPFVTECPYCDMPMTCDTVDIGVGFTQCGPYHCDQCGASEMGPEAVARFLKNPTPEQLAFLETIDDDELQTGFYKNRVSPHANTVNGVLVDHVVAKAAYRRGLLDPKPK